MAKKNLPLVSELSWWASMTSNTLWSLRMIPTFAVELAAKTAAVVLVARLLGVKI